MRTSSFRIVPFNFTPPYTPTFHTLGLEDKKGCTTKGCTNTPIPGATVCISCLRRNPLKRTSMNMLENPAEG